MWDNVIMMLFIVRHYILLIYVYSAGIYMFDCLCPFIYFLCVFHCLICVTTTKPSVTMKGCCQVYHFYFEEPEVSVFW